MHAPPYQGSSPASWNRPPPRRPPPPPYPNLPCSYAAVVHTANFTEPLPPAARVPSPLPAIVLSKSLSLDFLFRFSLNPSITSVSVAEEVRNLLTNFCVQVSPHDVQHYHEYRSSEEKYSTARTVFGLDGPFFQQAQNSLPFSFWPVLSAAGRLVSAEPQTVAHTRCPAAK